MGEVVWLCFVVRSLEMEGRRGGNVWSVGALRVRVWVWCHTLRPTSCYMLA